MRGLGQPNSTDNQVDRMLDNSGNGPLKVPGFGGVPLDYERPGKDQFATIHDWEQRPAVTRRETVMVVVMEVLTDRPNWHVDVFNDDVIQSWRQELAESHDYITSLWLEEPEPHSDNDDDAVMDRREIGERAYNETSALINDSTWDWCIKELRDKALALRKTGYVRILDTGSCICKSDDLPLQELAATIIKASEPLLDREFQQQQHRHQIDSTLYPLVYGTTPVLVDGGRVHLNQLFPPSTQLQIAPLRDTVYDKTSKPFLWNKDNHKFHWSSNYQRLPTEVEFLPDGNGNGQPRITSYINNLDPSNEEMYHAIEKLIAKVIPMWNGCLFKRNKNFDDKLNEGQRGCVPLRIITYGIEWENTLPEWVLQFRIPTDYDRKLHRKLKKAMQRWTGDEATNSLHALRTIKPSIDEVQKFKNRPDLSPQDAAYLSSALLHIEKETDRALFTIQTVRDNIAAFEKLLEADPKLPPEDSELWTKLDEYFPTWTYTSRVLKDKAWYFLSDPQRTMLQPKVPEPGISFSYEDWKSGLGHRAIVEMATDELDRKGLKATRPPFEGYKIALEETFRQDGLQIIIEMESIELVTGETAIDIDESTWESDSLRNEHIVALAEFTYSAENMAEVRQDFRETTPMDERFYHFVKYREPSPILDALPRERCWLGLGGEIEKQHLYDMFTQPPLMNAAVSHHIAWRPCGSVAMRSGRLVTYPNVFQHRYRRFEALDPTKPAHHRRIKLSLVDPNYRICSTRNVPPQQHSWRTERISADTLRLPQELADHVLESTTPYPMSEACAVEHAEHWKKEAQISRTAADHERPLSFWIDEVQPPLGIEHWFITET